MEDNQKLINWILKITVGTLASILIVVVLVLLSGIFMPNEVVNNDDIFAIIGPAFNTVIGAFVGLLGGLSINEHIKKSKNESQESEEDI
jgi:fumarate reductase subunit D